MYVVPRGTTVSWGSVKTPHLIIEDTMTIKTDKKWRKFKYGYELPKKWRKHFDWMSDASYETGNFVVYRGRVYALDEFLYTGNMSELRGWVGYLPDSYFSGVLLKVSSDGEEYMIGTYFS